ncbi:hypothetical protein J2T57_004059 [Natronocella acetinitrilica]|uniref:DUF3135 domain-containing protein n=1 Tax=Natronocella acetinitrilica TaxID=414046 RepID=A0AAE3G8T8_9GAMM|nr:DUF3135 domain-containing protein [Natronocella acetinitrilica]MCP1676886.1 hypothetical protein [Natronocella acetinitrilica]
MGRRLAAARIDFDSWSRMARDNPDQFERQRQAMIETMIRSADPVRQQRLRQLQWRIDQERRRARTPVAACVALSRMMWNQVYGETGLLSAMDHLGQRWRGETDAEAWPPAPACGVVALRANQAEAGSAD